MTWIKFNRHDYELPIEQDRRPETGYCTKMLTWIKLGAYTLLNSVLNICIPSTASVQLFDVLVYCLGMSNTYSRQAPRLEKDNRFTPRIHEFLEKNKMPMQSFKTSIAPQKSVRPCLLFTRFIILCFTCVPMVLYFTNNQIIDDQVIDIETLTTNQIFTLISDVCFYLIPPTQYLLGIIFWSGDHFDKMYAKSNTKHLRKQIMLFYVLLLTSIATVMNVLDNKIFLNVYLQTLFVTSIIISNVVVYINLVTFTWIFVKHTLIIKDYLRQLQQIKFTLNKTSRDILDIRNDLEASIIKLRNCWSLYTILGSLGIVFMFQVYQTNGYYPWMDLSMYLFTQLIFMLSIVYISIEKVRMTDYVRSHKFLERFLKRYTTEEIITLENKETIILNILEENSNMLDWIVLSDILREDWVDFKILGIDVTNANILKQAIVFFSLFVLITQYFRILETN